MKNKEEKIEKKRKISIITCFLWIFLVATMITVVTQNIKNTNALESDNVEIYGEISRLSKATNDTSNNKPQAPTVDKIISSIGPNIVINFNCANAKNNHNAVNTGIESGDKITVSEVIENDGSDGVSSVTYPWICDVGLDSEYWLNVYNNFASGKGWGNHLTLYNNDKLRLYYTQSNGSWSYRNSDLKFEFKIIDSPTVKTIYNNNNISLVSIECNNNSSDNKVYKSFISNDSFIVEDVMLNDGSYGESSSTYPCICDIRLNSDYWLEKYNQYLGVEHSVVQNSQKLRLFYNKNYNEWTYYAKSIPLKIKVKEAKDIEKISITKTSSERYPYIGEEFTYTIEIKNENDVSIFANVIDELPDGLEFLGVSESDGGIYDESCNTVIWNNIIVPAYGSREVHLFVKATKLGDILNEAKIILADGRSKSGGINVTVGDIEKISITKTSSERYPYIGEEFRYIIKIENENNFSILVNVIDELPDGIEFLGVSESDGGIYDESCNTVIWNNIHVPAYGSKELYLFVKATKLGDILNEAKIILHDNTIMLANTNVTAKNINYRISWYDEDKTTVLETNTFNYGDAEPMFSHELPTKAKDENYTYRFLQWGKQDTPLNDDYISYVAEYKKIPIVYGSYVVKHEYYTKDNEENIKLEDTYISNVIENIEVGKKVGVSSEDEIVDIEINMELIHKIDDKEYTYKYLENSGNIVIEENMEKEIIIKYIRDITDEPNILDNNVDTSDINIWLYVTIFVIAAIVIIVIFMVLKNK